MVDPEIRRTHGFHPLRVERIVQETADTRSFALAVPDGQRDDFAYRPGQFCTFRVTVGGAEVMRCYSMSSAPESGELVVTVKRVPDGLVSNWLHDNVATGDVLEVARPAGSFCPRDGGRPIVAFCGGSGITPVMSIARSLLASSDRPIRLVYANRDRGSVIFGAALEQLQADHADQLRVHLHHDAEAGYLDAAGVAAHVADPTGTDFYLCGPTPFMDLVETSLLGLGVDPERIAIERFVPGGPLPTDEPPAEPEGDAAPDATETVTLILKGKASTIAYQPGDSVLATARRGGLTPPFSCESGHCATCMAMVREGAATMRVNDALTDAEVAEGWVLTCQARPVGRAVTIEYESF